MESQLATRQLPDGYTLTKEFNLSDSVVSKIVLSLASLVLFFLFWVLFTWLLGILRPGILEQQPGLSISFFGVDSVLFGLLVLVALTFAMVFLHEGIHGLFFWIFTKEKPCFGFKVVYAFAGAPDWYITKVPYLIIGISPLILITLVAFGLLLFLPPAWILPVLFFMTLNASGAVGDIYTIFWLVRAPRNILVNDTGDHVTVFAD